MEAVEASGTSGRGCPDVSVIIVNWNTRDVLRDCLRSVFDQTSSSVEVIVVDNASRDGSAGMVRQEFPDVVLIANDDNRGFAAANNQGLEIARGQNLLLLNPDTLVLEGAIDKMLHWLQEHQDVGCVGCQVLEGPGIIQQTCFSDPSPVNLFIVEFGLMRFWRIVPRLGQPWYRDWARDSERDVDVVSGMFMLVPRPVYDAVGPLDPAFFVYAEEADWCRRIRKAGWRCVFAPVAQIVHLDGGSKSTSQIRPRMFVQMQKSHLIYVRKHHGVVGHAVSKGMFVSSSVLRGALFGAIGLLTGKADHRARVSLSLASLRFLLLGKSPSA